MTTASDEPRISVLLPVRDAGATLGACLHSVERQSEPRFECLIVDDGSNDDSLAIARAFVDRDRRFRVLALERRGLVKTLNAGARACRGRYVARMDADDLMHRARLGRQRQVLDDRADLAGVGCHVRLFPRRGLGPGTREYEAWLNGLESETAVRRDAFVECPLAHPTWMLRREVLRRYGYRDRGWPEDYDLLLRLLADGLRLGVVPRRLLCWRHGPGRLSRTSAAYAPERFTACKSEFLATGFLAGSERYDLWGYGATGRALVAALWRLGKRPARIVELHPGRIGNVIAGATVVPPDALGGPPGLPLLVSVAGATPRDRIRRHLDDRGYHELHHYLCTA
jgi:glycosyltransferase involved in cell wall biosynthesis